MKVDLAVDEARDLERPRLGRHLRALSSGGVDPVEAGVRGEEGECAGGVDRDRGRCRRQRLGHLGERHVVPGLPGAEAGAEGASGGGRPAGDDHEHTGGGEEAPPRSRPVERVVLRALVLRTIGVVLRVPGPDDPRRLVRLVADVGAGRRAERLPAAGRGPGEQDEGADPGRTGGEARHHVAGRRAGQLLRGPGADDREGGEACGGDRSVPSRHESEHHGEAPR